MELTLRREEAALAAVYGDLLPVQLELEQKMVALGVEQVRKQIAAAKLGERESDTVYGKRLVARSITVVADAIDRFLSASGKGAGRRHIAAKYLSQLPSDVAAFIGVRVIVDGLTGRQQLLQRVAVMIARRIEDEVRFSDFKDTDARAYNRALQKAVKTGVYHRKKASMAGYERRAMAEFAEENGIEAHEWEAWPESDCLHIGMKIVEIAQQADLIALGDKITSRTDTVKIIEPTASLMTWIDQYAASSELLHPMAMPMVVKPLEWTTPFDGGYLSQDAQGRATLVKVSNINYLTELADHANEMPVVYTAVNALQNTGWVINHAVLEVVHHVWEQGHSLAGVPANEDIGFCACPKCEQMVPLPKLHTRASTPHECFEDAETLRSWKQKAFECHSSNVSTRSKRLSLKKTLDTADLFAKHSSFYIPYQLDFRGRIYAIPTFNPQGNDVTKALLHFAEAKPINDGVAAGWLAIHGANVYGFDKASLEDRIEWVEERQDLILACAADPMACTFWADADKPWQFLAFCFEWAGFCREGYGFMSRMAVALDGSCSGIQHFSAMLRDTEGGMAVNLLPSKVPADIYRRVADRVVAKLVERAGELSSTIAKANPFPLSLKKEEAEATVNAIAKEAEATGWTDELLSVCFLLLGISRKTTKRQVMTLPYGATIFSCREYTSAWLSEQFKKGGYANPFGKTGEFKAANFLSSLIWASISEVVVGARHAMDWLQSCAKVVAEEELPVYWTTPTGFRVMQQYKNISTRRVKTKLGDVVVKLTLKEDLDTIDKRRMALAISPNFIHSMDATHLMVSTDVAVCNGINAFAMIHDSFGTHAADTNMLAACLREAFVDLYSSMDVLEDFRGQIIRQVSEESGLKVRPVPAKGSLDLEQVRDSDFFFC